MIYQDKTPALAEEPAVQRDQRATRRQAATPFVNHRVVRGRGKPLPQTLTLFDKVKNYKNAAEVRALGLYPYFRTISSAQDTEVMIEGKKVLMLGSNSYLGLTNHPKIKEAARAAVEKYGTG